MTQLKVRGRRDAVDEQGVGSAASFPNFDVVGGRGGQTEYCENEIVRQAVVVGDETDIDIVGLRTTRA